MFLRKATQRQKQYEKNMIKSIRKKQKKNKDRTIKDIRNLLEQSNDCCKPIRVGNFWNNKYWIWK